MEKIKVKITEDRGSEMLKIETETECLFEGNYWDFDCCGSVFKKLFESIGADVELEEKNYNTWNRKK